jgi:tetratricopeptide (TPR) repeat protein
MKIFLSGVSSQFKACREALRSDLSAVGAKVAVQEDFQQHKASLLEKLERYIASCDRVIALVGDAYGFEPEEPARPLGRPRRSYTQWEYFFAMGERLDGSLQPPKDIFLYLGSPDFLAMHPVSQLDDAAKLQQKFIKELVRSGKDRNQFGLLHELCRLVLRDGFQLRTRAPQPRNLPYTSIGRLFKGREYTLADVHERLQKNPGRALVIYGPAGVGKTRLTIEYAMRHEAQYTALLDVGASSCEALKRNLAALCDAQVLNLPERKAEKQKDQVAAVKRWLSEHSDWLLILDNADTRESAEAVEELLPWLQAGHLVVTSRLSDWSGSVESFKLELLSEAAAVEFLLERTKDRCVNAGSDYGKARELANALDGLALELEQAGAFINQMRCSFDDYLRRWHAREKKVRTWHNARLMHYPLSVAITWDTSFEQLDWGARDLLNLLSWLAPEPIPRALTACAKLRKQTTVKENGAGPELLSLLRRLIAKAFSRELTARAKLQKTNATDEALAAEGDVQQALAELGGFSMLEWDTGNQAFRIHRLVRDVIRERQPEEQRSVILQSALLMVNNYLPDDPPPDDVRSGPIYEPIVAHLRELISEAVQARIGQPTSRLANKLALFIAANSLWSEADALLRLARSIYRLAPWDINTPPVEVIGIFDNLIRAGEHPSVAIHLNNLMESLKPAMHFQEAALARLALSYVGDWPEHPRIAIDLISLSGHARDAAMRCVQAEHLARLALSIDEQSYGPEDPRITIDLNNLAQSLKGTHKLTEAEPLMRRALSIDEKSYGLEHPRVAIDLNNLALLLQVANRLTEAEPLYRRALAIDEKSLGPKHPAVARDLNNLAALLRADNWLAEAESLYRRALAIDEKIHTFKYWRVAEDLDNLAQLLQDTNRLTEAEPLRRRSLQILAEFSGRIRHEHPRLRDGIENYSELLAAIGLSEDEIWDRVRSALQEMGNKVRVIAPTTDRI